jgi:4-amino-4-deoxy-L-arabinose transferase-like glycosyltransferase
VCLVAVAIAILWVLPMGSSFWLDETATYWVIKDSFGEAMHRCMEWVGQSPLHCSIEWLVLQVGGPHEWVLRLPSVLSGIGAAWLLFKLARRLFDVQVAQLAVLFFVCSELVILAACDARPYAMGIFLLLGSAWLLLRWLETGKLIHGMGYAMATALCIHAHYFMGPVVAVLGIYGIIRAWREGRVRPWWMLVAWAGAGMLVMPLLPQLKHYYLDRAAHSFSDTPQPGDLVMSLAPPGLATALGVGLCIAQRIPGRGTRGGMSRYGGLMLAAAWALAPTVVLFTISVATPVKLFVPRYYFSSIVGVCMLAGWLVASLVPASRQRLVVGVGVVLSVVLYASARHHTQDFRGAMNLTRAQAGPSVPVLVVSGFVEASDPKAFDDVMLREVLFSPQEMYPPGGELVRLPYRLDEKSKAYMEGLIPSLAQSDHLFLVVMSNGLSFEPWLTGRLVEKGYRSKCVGEFGTVIVYRFER